MDCTGRYMYLDGVIMPAEGSDDLPPGEVSFYEVIRTRNGIPVFFTDHMKRLRDGISTRYDLVSDIDAEVRAGLNALVSREKHDEINVRVTVSFTGSDYSLQICYIPSFYPSDRIVAEGVHLILYRAERIDPGVKMLNMRLRQSVNGELERRKAYEALLVNRDGYITEGSRSNVFFVTDGGTIHTAPDNLVLSGVTRRHVTEIIRQEGIPLMFKAVREDETGMFRSVFITGTSPMVLAVKSIEGRQYDADDPIIRTLREVYARMADTSIRDYYLDDKAD